MKKLTLNILFWTLMLFVTPVEKASAISKIEGDGPIAELADQVQKIKEDVQEKINKATGDLEQKVLAATGAEGQTVYKFMSKHFGGTIKQGFSQMVNNAKNGDFSFDMNGMLQSLKNEGQSMLELESLQETLTDYDKAKADEYNAKVLNIKARMTQLDLEMNSEGFKAKTAEEQEKIQNESAELSAQLQILENNQSAIDQKREAILKKIDIVNQTMKKFSNLDQYMEGKAMAVMDVLGSKLAEELFSTEQEENEDNSKLYQDNIENFFMARLEANNYTNKKRIQDNRDKAYYTALQDVMRAAVATEVAGKELSDKSTEMSDTTTKVDGVYGGMSMTIGADIQRAKAAARYTEVLLAEMRMTTMKDIVSWRDMFKLKDYKKDVTTLNLDDYILKKSDYTESLWDKAKGAVNGKIQDAIDKQLK